MRKDKYHGPLLTRKEYFNSWDKKELERLKGKYKKIIYNEYRTKHIVFNRDNFTCQALSYNKKKDKWEPCKYKGSPFTLHHYKHASNGGETKPRNCITVCKAHQKIYHSGKGPLKFKDREELPNHIAGHTQAHEWYVNGKNNSSRETDFISKKIIKENRKLRKRNKEYWGIRLTWKEIYHLLKFLFNFEYERVITG